MGNFERTALDVIKSRHSSRQFTEEPVSRTQLEMIVDAGRQAASARNIQPWHFVVVTDRAKLRRLGNITDHGKFIGDAAACIVVLCEDTKYYLEDGAAAVENILLAAEAMNLASCWVAGDKKPYAEEILKAINAPVGEMKLIALVAVGHEAECPLRAVKKPIDQVLHWESF